MRCFNDEVFTFSTRQVFTFPRLNPSVRCLDEFIRESQLIDPPLRNATFTCQICKLLFARGWMDSCSQMSGINSSLKVFKKHFLDGPWIIAKLAWIQTLLSGARLLLDLKICGCSTLILRKDLGVGSKSVRLIDGETEMY